MKVIDLLNKIANDEEVPDAIKWGCHDFEWFVYEYKAKDELGEPTLLEYLSQCPNMLNDEIITFNKIEEHKIPEKLNLDTDKLRGKETPRTIDYLIEDKINKILDYLEEIE